jgi:hypothetical protein
MKEENTLRTLSEPRKDIYILGRASCVEFRRKVSPAIVALGEDFKAVKWGGGCPNSGVAGGRLVRSVFYFLG